VLCLKTSLNHLPRPRTPGISGPFLGGPETGGAPGGGGVPRAGLDFGPILGGFWRSISYRLGLGGGAKFDPFSGFRINPGGAQKCPDFGLNSRDFGVGFGGAERGLAGIGTPSRSRGEENP